MADHGFIGVFDSGLGGISVLNRLVGLLPHERFVYFGDSAHNPYGAKTPQQILGYSREICANFVDEGAKALVIACNTATSVAADILRAEHPELPIVGIEPALKLAVEQGGKGGPTAHGRILVMATPVTLGLEKFQQLARSCGSSAEVVEAPCPGLAHRIEQGRLEDEDLLELIRSLVGEHRGKVDSVVLGCTHYPFVRAQIAEVLGEVPFFDGGPGASHRLRDLLAREALLAPEGQEGGVSFRSSAQDAGTLERYRRFFEMRL
ncbi:glutamate racemase [Olsenella urininfantis]|uniref:glutamate racemase n=1 Tax=Olsenella urininfantis TaxID=1871033 RepID=UPI000986C629|nr:glutamate racemase [Olsenella urininfantis]